MGLDLKQHLITSVALFAIAGCATRPAETEQDYAKVIAAGGFTYGYKLGRAEVCGADKAKVALAEVTATPPPGFAPTPQPYTSYVHNGVVRARLLTRTAARCISARDNKSLVELFPPKRNPSRLSRAERHQNAADDAADLAGLAADKAAAANSAQAADDYERQQRLTQIALAQCRYEATVLTAGIRETFLNLEKSMQQQRILRECVAARGL